jgi:hypothetical protein
MAFPVLPAAVVMGALASRKQAEEAKKQRAADILMSQASAAGADTYAPAAAGAERSAGNINVAGDLLQGYMSRKANKEMDSW